MYVHNYINNINYTKWASASEFVRWSAVSAFVYICQMDSRTKTKTSQGSNLHHRAFLPTLHFLFPKKSTMNTSMRAYRLA